MSSMTGSCTVPCPSAMWLITLSRVCTVYATYPVVGHMVTSWSVPMLQCLWSSRQYFNSVASKHRAEILAGLLQYTIKILNFFCFQKLNRMATPRGHSNSRQHMDSTWRMYADMFLGLPTALQRFYDWFTGVYGKTYHPSLSAAFTFTPNCTRNFTISVWPAHTALWRAVMPSSFGRLGSSTCHTNRNGERVTPISATSTVITNWLLRIKKIETLLTF